MLVWLTADWLTGAPATRNCAGCAVCWGVWYKHTHTPGVFGLSDKKKNAFPPRLRDGFATRRHSLLLGSLKKKQANCQCQQHDVKVTFGDPNGCSLFFLTLQHCG